MKRSNERKTTFTLFHKPRGNHSLSLQHPNLNIKNYKINRSTSIKFLCISVNEHLTWVDPLTIVENKLSKNLGLS